MKVEKIQPTCNLDSVRHRYLILIKTKFLK